jgi:uncharacterized protein YndB with AHSA1/START domain
LKEHLPRRTELVVTRTIDDPPPSVFEAWTDADLLWQWWIPIRPGCYACGAVWIERGAEPPSRVATAAPNVG